MMQPNANVNANIIHRPRVALDTIFFNMPYSGISRVWEGILSTLETDMLDIELIILIRGKEIPKNIAKSGFHKRFSQSQIIHINEFSYPIMQQDVDYLNKLSKTYHWNYFISTYFTFCTTIPNILLIHDMIPETFNLVRNHMWIQKDLAIRNASQFICISETTKNDLIKIYPYLTTEQYPIIIIYNAIPSHKIILADEKILEDEKIIQIDKKMILTEEKEYFEKNILIKQGIQPKKYILTIATNQEIYKNQILIKNLIDKYQQQLIIKFDSQIPLVIITKNILPRNGIVNNGVLLLSDISDLALQILYENAAMLINPSLAEGFGLPVFEAFLYKIPVIACKLPVYDELCPNAITYIENDIDDLFQKISHVLKHNATTQQRIENGIKYTSKYTLEKQIYGYTSLLNSLAHKYHHRANMTTKFVNIIFQSYLESNSARYKELEHCILSNLEHPSVKYIHDFAKNPKEYLPLSIINHPKYIHVPLDKSNNAAWLTYETAFTYSSSTEQTKCFGIYWGLINCDIMLSTNNSINWFLMRGWLNSKYILAQSRHEYIPTSNTAKMDTEFAKFMHANTQDAWFYSTEYPININNCNFEIGMLGCDNAIAHRALSSGYKVINMPETFPIWHYDIVRGKNSSNFLEKHSKLEIINNKPANTHPERSGQALIPNYDNLMSNNSNIDLLSIINQLGGISNWEKYKIIAEMFSSRIVIINPN